mgnify:CR=1 FL=1
MKLEVDRYGLEITVEPPQDVAYIEGILELRKEGQFVRLYRVNVMGLDKAAYLSTDPPDYIRVCPNCYAEKAEEAHDEEIGERQESRTGPAVGWVCPNCYAEKAAVGKETP